MSKKDGGLSDALGYIMGTPSDGVEPSPTALNTVEQRPTMSDSVEHSRLSFRLPEGKRQELERIAARRGMNLSNLVRSIVFEYLEKGR